MTAVATRLVREAHGERRVAVRGGIGRETVCHDWPGSLIQPTVRTLTFFIPFAALALVAPGCGKATNERAQSAEEPKPD
jgi:hypothetical protein